MSGEPRSGDVPRSNERLVADADLATQILVAGAAMAGVSLTLVGLLRIVQSVQSILGLADNILAAASVLFLFACLSGYLALRARSADSARQWLRVADALFIVGLLAMVSIGIMLAVELL